jgi:hypothetical protein
MEESVSPGILIGVGDCQLIADWVSLQETEGVTDANVEVRFRHQSRTVEESVERYRGDAQHRGFSCRDQYLAMAFAQLTYRESLRDIEACLGSMRGKLYDMGFRGRVARFSLGDANQTHGRGWSILCELDRGYIDFRRLHAFTLSLAFIVVRTKENILLQRRYSHPVDKSAGVRSDQSAVPKTIGSARYIRTRCAG